MSEHRSAAVSHAGLAAASGLLAGVAGLAVSIAATSALRLRLTPAYAVAEGLVEATPGRLVHLAIELVGRWDKPLLVGGVVAGLLGFCALAGVLGRRRIVAGELVLVALGLVGTVGVLTRPEAPPLAVVPVVLGTGTWLVLLPWLLGPVPSAGTGSPARRAFLGRLLLVGAGALAVGVAGRLVGRGRRSVEEVRARLDLPVSEGVVPDGADLRAGLDLDGGELEPWRVPNDEFYRIDTALVVPAVDVERWRLRIHGMVDRELVLTFDDLLDRRLSEAWLTLCCVSNPVGGDLIGNAWWSGVRVDALLAEAGPHPGADAVLQTSEDGWTCGTPLAALTDGRNALLAVAMNGEPLPLEHGFPVRMVVPGLYGYVSATKWLVDLEVTRFADVEAYWTQRGWSPEGPVRTQSRIDVPGANRRVLAGEVTVAGVAWAQHTGIEKVEVRLDGGPWTEVTLGRVPSVDTWVQWAGTVIADAGVHTLAVRATDASGLTQTAVRRDVVPDGATGWHTIEFTAE